MLMMQDHRDIGSEKVLSAHGQRKNHYLNLLHRLL